MISRKKQVQHDRGLHTGTRATTDTVHITDRGAGGYLQANHIQGAGVARQSMGGLEARREPSIGAGTRYAFKESQPVNRHTQGLP